MIVVLADDLSGAAELAGAALRHGLSAEVQTAFTAETEAEVICVDTDTRLRPPEEAARVVTTVAQRVVAAQPEWIFKKCDSVLRGPVLAEARALALVAGRTKILILPANPSRGRLIRGGLSLLAGRLLHETEFARDPTHPRTTAHVTALLGGDLTGVTTPDAETVADVARHALAVDDTTLPVGAVDFFAALLAQRILRPTREQGLAARSTPQSSAPDRTLIVCGSAASWTQRRATALAQGMAVFALPHDLSTALGAWRATGRILIGIGDGPATCGVSPESLVAQLATTVAAITRDIPPTQLLVEGGATTAAVLCALGWTRLRACAVAPQGVGVLCPVGAAGPLLVIKPGSYPWPDEFWPD